jgi:hypothetical protein
MARSLDQIAKDMAALEEATTAIDEKLQTLYGQYLPVLGTAVRQQLILAAYHLCTQTYPEAFLALSKGQREQVQGALRKLGRQGQSQIEALIKMDNVSATLSLLLKSADGLTRDAIAAAIEPDDLSATVPNPDASVEGRDGGESENEGQNDGANGDELIGDGTSGDGTTGDAEMADTAVDRDRAAAVPPGPDSLPPATEAEADAGAARVNPDEAPGEVATDDGEATPTDEDDPEGGDRPLQALPPEAMAAISEALAGVQPPAHPSPLHLAKRHVLMERQIRAILHTLSNTSNYMLKRAKILPDLPEAVLSAAAESEAGDTAPGVPNLLNVIVEMGQRLGEDGDDGDEEAVMEDPLEADDAPERAMTHLVAINLRLADIEFSDPQTALRRSRIQETLAKLKQLSSRYQKLQQEKARADAEALWRSTWFDNDVD